MCLICMSIWQCSLTNDTKLCSLKFLYVCMCTYSCCLSHYKTLILGVKQTVWSWSISWKSTSVKVSIYMPQVQYQYKYSLHNCTALSLQQHGWTWGLSKQPWARQQYVTSLLLNSTLYIPSISFTKEAEVSYKRAITHRKKYPDAYYNLGNLVRCLCMFFGYMSDVTP